MRIFMVLVGAIALFVGGAMLLDAALSGGNIIQMVDPLIIVLVAVVALSASGIMGALDRLRTPETDGYTRARDEHARAQLAQRDAAAQGQR